MSNEISEVSLIKMIEMGDKKNLGYIDFNSYMRLMQEIGLIKKETKLNLDNSDMEMMAFSAAAQLKENW